MLIYRLSLLIGMSLASFTLISCAAYDPEPINRLMFGAPPTPTPPLPASTQSKNADAISYLDKALMTPDRDSAAALIRSAIFALR